MKPIGKQWRLEDKEGKPLRIILAANRAAADLRGTHLFPGTYHHAVDLGAEKAKEGGSRMKKWRLEDKKGRTIKIVEAVDQAGADVIGLKTFPAKYHRAVSLEVEEAKSEARLVELRESFKSKFLQEGRSEEEAETMAEAAARGRNGR
jgi:hypothetical protein